MKDVSAAFAGDARGSATEISLNRKGGSLTATLKKALTDQVSAFSGISKMYGAAIPLEDGDGLVVLSTLVDEDDPQVTMRRVSENRYEIVVGEEETVSLDPVTLALLNLKEAEIASGRAELAEKTTDDILARMIR